MKPTVHQYEDKLLEFAYGELPANEAEAVDAHVRGCARCSESIAQIRSVRSAMSQLPAEAAPDAGLDSLLAYAEQHAKRNADAKKQTTWWRRYLMPLATVATLLVVGVVAWRASDEFNTDPAAVALEMEREREKEGAAQPPPPPAVAQAPAPADDMAGKKKEQPALLDNAFGVAEGKEQEEVARRLDEAGAKNLAAADKTAEKTVAKQEEKQGKLGADRGELDALAKAAPAKKAPAPKVALQKADSDVPQGARASDSKRQQAQQAKPATDGRLQDWSNAALRGANKSGDVGGEVAKAERSEPTKESKPVYGLGAGPGGQTGSGGGAAEQRNAREEVATAETKTESKKKAKDAPKPEPMPEEAPAANQPVPQVIAAAPPPTPAPTSMPAKGSLSMGGMTRSPKTSSISADDEIASEGMIASSSDRLKANRDAEYLQRQRAAERAKNLEAARDASRSNNRQLEIKYAQDVLRDATGYERIEALKRLCDAFEAIGEPDLGDRYCDMLVSEFPSSAAAKQVSDRRKLMQKMPMPAARTRKASESQYDFESEKKPAEPASKPAEAF